MNVRTTFKEEEVNSNRPNKSVEDDLVSESVSEEQISPAMIKKGERHVIEVDYSQSS